MPAVVSAALALAPPAAAATDVAARPTVEAAALPAPAEPSATAEGPRLEATAAHAAPPPSRGRALLVLGAHATGLGAASLITGSVLIALPDRVIVEDPAYLRSYQTPGITVAVLGGAVLAAGVVMLVAALRGRARSRRLRTHEPL